MIYDAFLLVYVLCFFIIIFISFYYKIIEKNKEKKLIKKHIKKRKTIFLLLGVFSLLFIWSHLEKSFSYITNLVIFIIYNLIFISFVSYSLYEFFKDKNRIESAILRRKKREG